jgi:uncharacterized membrane protein (DUF2068 family)
VTIDLEETTAPSAVMGAEAKTPRRGQKRVHPPSFPELVYAHFAWWKSVHRPNSNPAAEAGYGHILSRFEEAHGQIVDSYWCSHVESAVVLTEKKPALRWRSPQLTFHRVTDWATKSHPDVAAQLHRCDELAIRAKSVLNGVRQRICLELVMSSASHLLGLVDARAALLDEQKTATGLGQERALLDKVDAYYRQAANGQAQIVYFAGMAITAVVVSALAGGLWLSLGWHSWMAAVIAGAIGAVVSVIQRINAGNFDLSYDVGRPYAFFLGGLRPLIGAAFALAVSFAFSSGMLHAPISGNDPAKNHLALLVIAFFAGFSERWAQDTLATALPAASLHPQMSSGEPPVSDPSGPSRQVP